MALDLQKYRPYLNDFDMSEDKKTEFIEAMAFIMESFADQAFGLDSIHQIYPSTTQENCPASSKMLNSNQLQTIIDNAANDNNGSFTSSNPKAKASP